MTDTTCMPGDTATAVATARRVPDEHRRLRRADDERGLTTLEWLLIVAAVAGLAALAVVLVQNVVGDTSEQIAGSSARKTAAIIAADQIMRDADQNASEQPLGAKKYDEWEQHYKSRCDRLEITYGDAGIASYAKFEYTVKDATESEKKAQQDVEETEITTFDPNGDNNTGTNFDDDSGAEVAGLRDGDPAAQAAFAHCMVKDK
ncbi:hypothetical protein [Candidatus Poriferisodalis sp.]|uniref:hypothetical protein n=1 Tax=Candidatus Poriferisodalis sp. TaxID=3101277 RepID=UPI003B02371A